MLVPEGCSCQRFSARRKNVRWHWIFFFVLVHSTSLVISLEQAFNTVEENWSDNILEENWSDSRFDEESWSNSRVEEENWSDSLSFPAFSDAEVPVILVNNDVEKNLEILNTESMVTIDIGQNLRVLRGASVTINCLATGLPKPKITWELNRKAIKDKLILQTASSLVIVKFQPYHSGYYTCLAKNEFGQSSAYSNIHENKAPPKILSSDGNVVVSKISKNKTEEITIGDRLSGLQGSRVVIRCPFVGFPYPRATWFFNDEVIDHAKDKNIEISEPDSLSLLTVKILDKAHEGSYKCSLFNTYGRAASISLVRLITPGQPTILSTRLTKTFSSFELQANISIGTNITVFDNTDVYIYCQVSAGVIEHKTTFLEYTNFTTIANNYTMLGNNTNDAMGVNGTQFEMRSIVTTKSRSNYTKTNYTVKWLTPSSSKRFKIQPTGKMLTMKDVTVADAGIYACVVSNGAAGGDKQITKMNVVEKILPTIEVKNRTVRYLRGWNDAYVNIGESLVVKVGLDVLLSCPFKAYPKGTLSWYKNGVKLSLPDNSLNMEGDGDTLKIRDIQTYHADKYTCVITSILGTASASTDIKTISRRARVPTINKSRKRNMEVLNTETMVEVNVGESLKVVEGASITLKCDATGIPQPEITWEVNRKPVKDKYILHTSNSLVFIKFQKYHSGYYKCNARNIMGEARAFSDIRIRAPTELKILKSKGSFQITQKTSIVKFTVGENIKTTGGRHIVIRCPTEGTPKPKVMWKRNGEMLYAKDRVKFVKGQSILIQNVTQWDSGNYMCYAGNDFSVISASSNLVILPEGSPLITTVGKTVRALMVRNLVDVDIGTNLTTVTGNSLRIFCPAVGEGELFYDWTIDGKPLVYDTRMSLQISNQLIIRELQFFDNGMYTCRVYNQFGSDSVTSLITIVDGRSTIGGVSLNQIGKKRTVSISSKTQIIESAPLNGIHQIPIGSNIEITKGKSVELLCPTRGRHRPQLTWMKDGIPITPDNYIVPRGEVLRLQMANSGVNGNYSCKLVSAYGNSIRTSIIKVMDHVPLRILKKNRRVQAVDMNRQVKTSIGNMISAIDGVTIVIECPHVAKPPADITWQFNARRIGDSPRYSYGKKHNSLIIPKMEKSYIGRYTCKAQQGKRVKMAYARVKQLAMVKPTIRCTKNEFFTDPNGKLPVHIKVGDSVTANLLKKIFIHCSAIGVPKPKVVWKMNGKPIDTLAAFVQDLKNGSLLIKSVQWEHNGSFACYQINPAGLATCATKVKVYGRFSPTQYLAPLKKRDIKSGSKNNIAVLGNDISIQQGNSIVLKCPVNSYGFVDVYWKKDGKKFYGNSYIRDGSITLRKLEKKDSGIYMCYSQDKANVRFGNITLKVVAPLEDLFIRPPQGMMDEIDDGDIYKEKQIFVGKNISVFVGGAIKLICRLKSGIRTLNVTWLMNGKRVDIGEYYRVDGNIMYFRDTEKPGNFSITCLVTGSLGSAKIVSSVRVKEKLMVKINRGKGIFKGEDPTKPLVAVIGSNVLAIPGLTIKITCPHVASPVATLSWFFNSTVIANNPLFAHEKNGEVLVIPKMSPKYVGTYVCLATQGIYRSSVSSFITLLSMRKPTILKSNRKLFSTPSNENIIYLTIGDSLTANLEKNVMIQCSGFGLPKPKTIWKFNGKPITLVKNVDILKNGSLMINSVSWQNLGSFECFQTNPTGIDSAFSKLIVVGKYTPTNYSSENASQIYKVKDQDSSVSIGSVVTVQEGNSLHLKCPVDQFGPVAVMWDKAGNIVDRSHQNVDGSLMLKKLRMKDSGDYTCYSNDAAKVNFGYVKVKVLESVKNFIIKSNAKPIEYIYGPFKEIEADSGVKMRILSGNTIKLNCQVKPAPNLNITWLKDGKPIKAGKKYFVNDDVLVIKDTSTVGKLSISCVISGELESTQVVSEIEIVATTPAMIKSKKAFVKGTELSEKLVAVIGNTVRAISGITIAIECPHVALPAGKIVWYINKTKITDKKKYHVEKDSDALIIPKMGPDYVGNYTCQLLQGSLVKTARSQVSLISMVAPKIYKSKKYFYTIPSSDAMIHMSIGDSITTNILKTILIHCRITGLPKASFVWMFNGKEISKLENVVTLPNGTLKINYVSWKHQGVFECFQTNPAGLDSATTKVDVLGPYTPTRYSPRRRRVKVLKVRSKTMAITIGTNITTAEMNSLLLRCPINKFGIVDVIWEKEGEKLEGSGQNVFLTNVKNEDSGTYVCYADDVSKFKFGAVTVKVVVPPTKLIKRPKLKEMKFVRGTYKEVNINIGTNLQVLSGNTVRIKCPLVSDKSSAKVTWRKNGKPVKENKNLFSNGNLLTIRDTWRPNFFIIACVATDSLGTGKMQSKIEVVGLKKPKIIRTDKKVVTTPKTTGKVHLTIGDSVLSNIGKTLMIHCPSVGVPKPRVMWKFNGKPLILVKNLIKSKNGSSVTVKEVKWENEGSFECYRVNAAGLDTATTKLTVYGADTPTKFSPKKVTLNFMDLKKNTQAVAPIGSKVFISERKTLQLNCSINIHGPVEIYWMKDGKMKTGLQKIGGGNAVLKNIKLKDAGIYECFSKDKANVKFGSVTLKVLVPLSDLIFRPRVKELQYFKPARTEIAVDIGANLKMLTGNYIRFLCRVKSSPGIKITWLKNNKPLIRTFGYIVNGNILRVRNNRKAELYNITCMVSRKSIQKSTSGISSKIEVVESKRPEIKTKFETIRARDPEKDVKAVIGNIINTIPGISIEIRCPHTAVPPADITWYFGSKKIIPDLNYIIIKDKNALIIPKMGKEYEGEYKCNATQGKFSVEAKSKVILTDMEKPTISKSDGKYFTTPSFRGINYIKIGDSIVTNLYQNVMIICPVFGMPQPRVFWKFNDKPLTTASNVVDFKNGSLLIRSVLWKNDGLVECYGSNPVGLDSLTSKISVVGAFTPTEYQPVKRQLESLKPEKKHLNAPIGSSVSIRKGNSLLITCPVHKFGRVSVIWEKDGKIHKGKGTVDGGLDLQNIKSDQSGSYFCYSNDRAKVKFGAVNVKVFEPVEDMIIKERKNVRTGEVSKQLTTDVGGNVTVFSGVTFKLVCPIKPESNIKLTWRKNSKKISSNRQFLIDKANLLVLDTRVATTYTISCVVTGKLGSVKITSNVKVVDYQPVKILSQPRKMKITDASQTLKTIIGSSISAIVGSTVEISCPYFALPKPEIIWLLNATDVTNDIRYPLVSQDNTLVIMKMSQDYVGNYTCKLVQGKRVVMSHSMVNLLTMEQPQIRFSNMSFFTVPLSKRVTYMHAGDSIIANLRSRIIISCISKGIPEPTVTWTFNDKLIKPNMGVTTLNNGSLEIKFVRWKHGGTYSCISANPSGVDSASSVVKVYGLFTPTQFVPAKKEVKVLKLLRANILVRIGTNVTIRAMNRLMMICPVTKHGRVRVFWRKDGIPFNRTRKDFSVRLTLIDIEKSDSGNYECVSNDQAKVKFGAVSVKVLEPLETLFKSSNNPNKTFVAKRLVNRLIASDSFEVQTAMIGTKVRMLSGSGIKFICQLNEEEEKVKIEWLKNEKKISKRDKKYEMTGNELIVKDIGTHGNHTVTCAISGILGVAKKTSFIEVIEYKPVRILRKYNTVQFTDSSLIGKAVIGQRVQALLGVSFQIHCPYISVPNPVILWFFNDTAIDKSLKYSVNKDNDALVIPKMARDYEGKYTCIATQDEQNATASSEISILVMKTPSILKSNRTLRTVPSESVVTEMRIGDSITTNLYKKIIFQCSSSGLPMPKVMWQFKGKPVDTFQNFIDFKNGSLAIKSVLWIHEGLLECYSINPAGLDTAASNIKVYGQYTPTNFVPVEKEIKVLIQSRVTISANIGSKVTIREGNTLMLTCPVMSYGPVDIVWFKDGEKNSVEGQYLKSFKLKKLTVKDSGDYVCYSNDLAKVKFGTVAVTVLEPLNGLIIRPQTKLIRSLEYSSEGLEASAGTDVELLTGNLLKLRCMLRSDANINITWTRNGENLANAPGYNIEGNLLHIKDTAEPGIHNFSCVIAGLLGREEIMSKVTVIVPTKLTMRKISQSIISTKLQGEFMVGGSLKLRRGSSVEFICPISGVPPPTIEWLLNGEKIEKNNQLGFDLGEQNKVLSIGTILEQHSGVYQCTASNMLGEWQQASMNVEVYEPLGAQIIVRPHQPELPGMLGRNSIYLPSVSAAIVSWDEKSESEEENDSEVKIGLVGQDYKILTGLQLNLSCPVVGRPQPSIIWKKDGMNISNDVEYLTIDTKNARGSGLYSCSAFNVFGSVTEKSNVHVIVPSKPVIQREPVLANKTAYIARMDGVTKVDVSIGDNLETISGTTVSIQCPAIGIPRPNISYFKDNQPLKTSNQIFVDMLGSLLLSPATLERKSNGVYTCRAENEAGSAELSTRLDLYKPLKPEILPAKSEVSYEYNTTLNKGKLVMSIGQSAVAYPNTVIVIKCPVAGFPFPVIIWEKEKKILAETPAGVSKDEATNLVYYLKNGDGGEFFCTATNMAGSVKKKAVVTMKTPSSALIVATKYRLITANKMSESITIGENAKLLMNSSLKISCPSVGEPEPTLSWSVKNKPVNWLKNNKYVTISKSGDEIMISRMTLELAGVYKCTARNMFGSDAKVSSLSVKDIYQPTIKVSNKKVIAQDDVQEVTAVIGGELFVRPNTRVFILCEVNGSPPPTVKWFYLGKEVVLNIDPDTNTLKLPRAHLINEGTYTCVAESFINVTRAETKLHIGNRPTINKVPKLLSPIISTTEYSEITIPIGVDEAFVRAGSTAVFKCDWKGYPRPNITWSHNRNAIDYTKELKKYQSLIPKILEVKKLVASDAGVYSCMVENVFGRSMKKTKLEILEAPVILKSKTNITFYSSTGHVKVDVGGGIIVLKGASVSLSCPATGKPTPTIKWSKRNTTFFVDPRFTLSNDKQLTITNIQLRDSGDYFCTAKNNVASAKSFLRLLVADKPKAVIIPNHRPKGTGKLAGVLDNGKLIVPAGSPIHLLCRVSGSPGPRITWLKDHSIVIMSERFRVREGFLEVKYAIEADAGTYVCMVENLLGVTTASTQVIIGAPPKIFKEESARELRNKSVVEIMIGSSIKLYAGSTVKLHCNATGIPKPVIVWERVEKRFRRGVVKSQTVGSDVLTVRDISPESTGNITCVAKNVIGMDRVTSTITVIDPPKILTDVTINGNLMPTRTRRYFMMGRDKQIDVIEGEDVHLVCVSKGSPYTNVTISHPPVNISHEEILDILHSASANRMSNYLESLDENSGSTMEKFLFSPRKWLKQSLKLQQVTRFSQKIVSMVAVATIHNIELLHQRRYVCNANNSAGSDSVDIRINVHPKPVKPNTGTWIVSKFGKCSTPCIRADYGTQRRNVTCLTYGGKITGSFRCGVKDKPVATQGCPTMQCTTEWRTGGWSKCSATCGNTGVQERLLYCVYSKLNIRTDAANCDKLKRKPITKRSCNQYPCSRELCIDKYQYCKHMKKTGFCRMQKYKTLCCASCIKDLFSNT